MQRLAGSHDRFFDLWPAFTRRLANDGSESKKKLIIQAERLT